MVWGGDDVEGVFPVLEQDHVVAFLWSGSQTSNFNKEYIEHNVQERVVHSGENLLKDWMDTGYFPGSIVHVIMVQVFEDSQVDYSVVISFFFVNTE